MPTRSILGLLAGTLFMSVPAAAQSADILVRRLTGNSRVQAALEFVERDQDRTIRDMAELGRIAESGGSETAQAFLDRLKALMLTEARMDAVGNALAFRKGTGGPLVVVAAPLDAPDGVRSAAVVLAIVRAMNSANIQTKSDLLFVGSGGRLDPDKYRGIKHVFHESEIKNQIRFFVAIDGKSPQRLSSAPKTIGSTFVQLAYQAISTFGLKPDYDNDNAEASVAIELKVPSITIGAGDLEKSSSVKSIQIALTTILAIAGITM